MIKLILNRKVIKTPITKLRSNFMERCNDCKGSGHSLNDRNCSCCNGSGLI